MQRTSSNIKVFAGFLVVFLIVLGCRREPVVEEIADTGLNISSFQNNVIQLDTLIFLNPVRSNGQVRFDLIGTPPQIQPGNIVYYPASGGFYGKVTSSSITGSRIFLQIEKSSIEQVFQSVVIQDNSSKNHLQSRIRIESGRWDSDTMNLGGWYLYNDVWQSKSLQVHIESGKFYSSSSIEQFMMAGQGSNPWFDRFGLVFGSSLILESEVTIKTGGAMDAIDSVLLEKVVYGPFLINSFPVTYQVDTWLGFHVVTQSDTVLSMKLSGITGGNLSLAYNYWDVWKFARNSAGQSANIQLFNGPKLTGYIEELFVNQIITPIFCGESSVSVANRFTALINSTVAVPNWQSSQIVNSKGIMFRKGSTFGAEVPASLVTSETILFTDYQSGVLDNQKPKASFLINPRAGFTHTNFELDASASSDFETSAESLMVRWDFDADNHFDTEFSTNKVVFYKYTVPGTYSIILEVKDEGELVARENSTVDVALSTSAPVAYFTISPESGRISDRFEFDAYGSYDAEDENNQLKVRWDFNGDGVWDTYWSTRKVEYYYFPDTGTYLAKLEVLDTQGLTGSTTRIINVSPANIKPTAFFTVNTESGTTATRFNFDASGSTDPEDLPEDLRVRWDWDNDGTFDTEYRTLKTIQHIFAIAGTYTVVLEVIDTEGYGATYSKEINVTDPNTPPEADFSVVPTPGRVQMPITFDASLCMDKEDSLDQLEVRWDWDNDNIYDTDFSTVKVFTKRFSEVGTYIIKVQVRDSGGLTDYRVRQLLIE